MKIRNRVRLAKAKLKLKEIKTEGLWANIFVLVWMGIMIVFLATRVFFDKSFGIVEILVMILIFTLVQDIIRNWRRKQ